jgi:hypothetical protein
MEGEGDSNRKNSWGSEEVQTLGPFKPNIIFLINLNKAN